MDFNKDTNIQDVLNQAPVSPLEGSQSSGLASAHPRAPEGFKCGIAGPMCNLSCKQRRCQRTDDKTCIYGKDSAGEPGRPRLFETDF